MITYNSLNKYKEIAHFCTERNGGASMGNYASFNISPYSGDNPENARKNKEAICQQLAIDSERLIIPYQSHGTKIVQIEDTFFQLTTEERSQVLYGVDALYTHLSHVCLAVTTADCVPILFFDPKKQVIAVAHAGWRGTCSRIAEKTAACLIDSFNCDPPDIRVVIGPSISVKVYEVGEEVVDKFKDAGFDISRIVTVRDQLYYLDLWEANNQSLQRVGISDHHIELSGICTYTEHERLFSARRLGIKSGRIASGIMLKHK